MLIYLDNTEEQPIIGAYRGNLKRVYRVLKDVLTPMNEALLFKFQFYS